MITASIVVPSWRRPRSLQNCLAGIAKLNSSHLVDQVIVVRRIDDSETGAVISSSGLPNIIEEVVTAGGVIAAVEAGARRCRSEIVAFLDDDTVPRVDWLEGLLSHYSPHVGAVGGRDVLEDDPQEPATEVGLVSSWGRLIGNHHLGQGPARQVHHLKGANMSVRQELLAFPTGLKGQGAQAYHDLATSLAVHQSGWKVIYDPATVVDHYPGRREDGVERGVRSARADQDSAFNLILVLASLCPKIRLRLFLYGTLIGNRDIPGIGRAGLALLQGEGRTFWRLVPSLTGQFKAWGRTLKKPMAMRMSNGDDIAAPHPGGGTSQDRELPPI